MDINKLIYAYQQVSNSPESGAKYSVCDAETRIGFGIINDYNERARKKLHNGTHLIPDRPLFFTTPARPGNFGDHIDMKVTLDNWFDENRTHNEKDDDIRRSQIYILNAFIYATGLSVARVFVSAAIWRYGGWQRYDKNSYLEVDIGDLPPGEVMQIVWDGAPVFVRRIAE